MEKIEVELTPVQIVEAPYKYAGGGLQPLRFQAVIEPIGYIENKVVTIPNPIYFNVPPEYVGRLYISLETSILEKSTEQIPHYHSITPEMIVTEQVILEKYVYIFPEITQTLPAQTVDVKVEDKVVEIEWINVPKYKIIGSSGKFILRDKDDDYSTLQNVTLNIKTNGVDNFKSYGKLHYLIRSSDSMQTAIIYPGFMSNTLINLPDVVSVSVVYEDTSENVRYEQLLEKAEV